MVGISIQRHGSDEPAREVEIASTERAWEITIEVGQSANATIELTDLAALRLAQHIQREIAERLMRPAGAP